MSREEYSAQTVNETQYCRNTAVAGQETVSRNSVPAADERPVRAWLRIGFMLFGIALTGMLVCLLLDRAMNLVHVSHGLYNGLLCSMCAGALLVLVMAPVLLFSRKFKLSTDNKNPGNAKVTCNFTMTPGITYSVAADGKWLADNVRSPYIFSLNGTGNHQVQLIAGGCRCVDTVTVRVR